MKILHLLRVQPLCVTVIKQWVQMADSKLSYHLNILKETGGSRPDRSTTETCNSSENTLPKSGRLQE